MRRGRGSAVAALLVVVALVMPALGGCDASEDAGSPGGGRAEGGGDAVADAPVAAVVLRDGVEAAPGTRVLGGGAGTTETGWYAALDLADAAPREVVTFYRQHLAALGFTVESGSGPLTVVAARGVGPTTQVRVDVVPASGDVPAFARVVARA